MMQPRVVNLFRNLDSQIPAEMLMVLDKKEAVYMFEFSKDNKSGVLYVYNAQEAASGKDIIPVETDWFNKDKLWFRKHADFSKPLRTKDKYEAFVSYLSDYRDIVSVDLTQPILRLEVQGVDAPEYHYRSSITSDSSVRAHPLLETTGLLFA